MIITMIVIASLIAVIGVKIALSTMTELMAADTSLRGVAVRNLTESCAQEALIHLNRDNTYAGEILDINDGTCNISVSGSGNERTIAIGGSLTNYMYAISIQVTLSPFSITAWDNP